MVASAEFMQAAAAQHVCQLLADHRVALTGCDTWSYGPVPPVEPDRPFRVPLILNIDHGVFVVVNLVLGVIAAEGVRGARRGRNGRRPVPARRESQTENEFTREE